MASPEYTVSMIILMHYVFPHALCISLLYNMYMYMHMYIYNVTGMLQSGAAFSLFL